MFAAAKQSGVHVEVRASMARGPRPAEVVLARGLHEATLDLVLNVWDHVNCNYFPSKARPVGPIPGKEKSMKRIATLAATLAVVLAAGVAIPSLVTSAGAAENSQVYVVHGIPGTPVDVYVNGDLTIPDFQPTDVKGPLSLPAGDYHVQIFAHVASPPDTAPSSGAVIDATKTVPAGASVSLIAHLGASGSPALNAFVNDTSAVAQGMARVTVRHTAAAPAVDVYVDGTKAISDLTNGNEAVAEIPAGSHEIVVKVAGTDTTVIGPATLDFAANTNTVVYAIGNAEGESLGVATQVLDTVEAPATTAPPTTMAPMEPADPTPGQPTFTG